MAVTTDSLLAFSANVNLHATAGAIAGITIPLVQGMGFVTAIYNSFTPYIDSSVFFNTVTPLPSPGTGITKYKLLLDDGNTVGFPILVATCLLTERFSGFYMLQHRTVPVYYLTLQAILAFRRLPLSQGRYKSPRTQAMMQVKKHSMICVRAHTQRAPQFLPLSTVILLITVLHERY